MTRMWCVPPQLMCRQHLLGEHKEIHQLVGAMLKDRWGVVRGHAERGQIQTSIIKSRHAALVREMLARGYNHASPLPDFPRTSIGRVDPDNSMRDLAQRCERCRELITKKGTRR